MSIGPAVVLGLAQGVTEFWPISSSAHLALLIHLFGWGEPDLSFMVALHLGTWLAVVWYYRRRLASIASACWREARGREHGGQEARLGRLLLLATLPGLVLGAVFAESSKIMEGMPLLMAVALAVFGLVLWGADRWGGEKKDWRSAGWRESLAVGVAQGLALMPGVSRSGITISTARAVGIDRREAADFAFLLSIPIIGAAAVYEGFKLVKEGIPAGSVWSMAAGCAAAAVSGYMAMGLLLSRLKTHTFKAYAIYRLALAAVLVVALVILG
ncbi:MAG: undecaprenyl-diphosphate phosphatase [Actinomycetota bacterium]|nr:undecaprenyl-diphosphate phosphatase [Actinomycetota bacterium]